MLQCLVLDSFNKIENLYTNRLIRLKIDIERVIVLFFCNIELKTIDKI